MSSLPQTPIDIETVIERRKRAWMKEARKTISVQERIATSVPWWLIIIACGAFALSAGHTAGLFNELSSVGYIAPFVVEFALLWAAFARTSMKGEKGGISLALRVLEVLAFIMAIGANVIGAMTRVALISNIDNFSFAKIVAAYGTLPITTQAAIFVVPLFGLFIPIVTWVAGEGLADLFLKQRTGGGLLEEKWREVEREELRRAFYAELISRGMVALDARRQAESLSTGFTHGQMRTLGAMPVSVQIEAVSKPAKTSAVTTKPTVRKSTRPEASIDVRAAIRTHLADHPADRKLSARNLSIVVVGHERSRQVANEELQRYRGNDAQPNDNN